MLFLMLGGLVEMIVVASETCVPFRSVTADCSVVTAVLFSVTACC